MKETMNIVIVGHVDHGKSTVVGRLLADTNSLPDGKLEQLKELCRRNAKPFEYAFLLDALKDERSQGITIDAARCFFRTDLREYIIIDAPGHIEFLKNMITGASRAEAALLVIDAREGICENSRRHGYMLSMLGISQLAVLVNKMDLVGYDRGVYEKIVSDYSDFLGKINLKPSTFIPVSATEGDNIAQKSQRMPWYKGETVLTELDRFENKADDASLPFRMPVQDVYKFTEQGDSRRIIAGYIESGRLHAGDNAVFYPSGKSAEVRSIESWSMADNFATVSEADAGVSTGFTTTAQIYTRRGEIACKLGESAPHVGRKFRASLFWLGRDSMTMTKTYRVKLGTAKVAAKLVKINSILDASTLTKTVRDTVDRFDIADVVIECASDIAFDITGTVAATSRFVVVDDFEISGGGIITQPVAGGSGRAVTDSPVTVSERARIYGQKPMRIKLDVNEKELHHIERVLLGEGRIIGLANNDETAGMLSVAGLVVLVSGSMSCDFAIDARDKSADDIADEIYRATDIEM